MLEELKKQVYEANMKILWRFLESRMQHLKKSKMTSLFDSRGEEKWQKFWLWMMKN